LSSISSQGWVIGEPPTDAMTMDLKLVVSRSGYNALMRLVRNDEVLASKIVAGQLTTLWDSLDPKGPGYHPQLVESIRQEATEPEG
jgi:hypothetical protein